MMTVLAFLVSPAAAQVDRAALTGTVTDASGAVLVDARVKATHEGSGQEREGIVGTSGAYVIPQLPIGTYTVQIEAPGFKGIRFDKVQLLDVASGGAEPEDGENARQAAPGKIQSLDRLVSLADFESEALAIAGVVKAAAAWDLVNNIPQVVLNILMDSGRDAELEAVRATIAEYNRGRGPNRFPVSVAPDGRRKYVAIDATYGFDPTFLKEEIESGIRIALGVNSGKPNAHDDQSGLFGLHRRGFGQREYASTIAGTIQQVPGVIWAQVTRFESLGIGDPATLVPSESVVLQPAVACESQHVLSLYSGHLKLTGVGETGVS